MTVRRQKHVLDLPVQSDLFEQCGPEPFERDMMSTCRKIQWSGEIRSRKCIRRATKELLEAGSLVPEQIQSPQLGLPHSAARLTDGHPGDCCLAYPVEHGAEIEGEEGKGDYKREAEKEDVLPAGAQL